MNSNLNNKKASPWISMAAIVILIVITIFRLNINSRNEQQYQFPLSSEDIERVLAEQGINMYIEDSSTIDESTHGPSLKDTIVSLANLKNDDNITFGINSQVRDKHKLLNLMWHLPKTTLSMDKIDDFFHNELSKQFELAGILYGNKKELNKELDKLLDYYLGEENYNNSVFWSKRVGNDHLRVSINNRTLPTTISMMIIPDEIYEDYLNSSNDAWKNTAEADNIKIHNSTIAEMKASAKEELPPENELDTFSKHFAIKGHLKNIKENKNVPEQLANIQSNYLMPNKDKYLSAKLVDDTGSVDVFLQMTSLTSNELSKDRNHNVVIFYKNGEVIYVVRNSTLGSKN